MAHPELCEAGNMSVAHTAMANEFGASAARRTNRADQTSADASAMWSIAMTTPTTNAALAYRTATESGSGASRATMGEAGVSSGNGGA